MAKSDGNSTNGGSAIKLAVIANDVAYIKDNVKDISDKLEKDYVTNDKFEPVKNIVYGLVILILTAVVGSVLAVILGLHR